MASREPRLKDSFRIKEQWVLVVQHCVPNRSYEALAALAFSLLVSSDYGSFRAARECARDSKARCDVDGSDANTSPGSRSSHLRTRSCVHPRLDSSCISVEPTDQKIFQRSVGHRRGPKVPRRLFQNRVGQHSRIAGNGPPRNSFTASRFQCCSDWLVPRFTGCSGLHPAIRHWFALGSSLRGQPGLSRAVRN